MKTNGLALSDVEEPIEDDEYLLDYTPAYREFQCTFAT